MCGEAEPTWCTCSSALGNPANLHKAVSLTEKEFKFGFGNALSGQESGELFGKWAIPAPARPLFQAAAEATEEAILNALTVAETMVGMHDRTAHALPHDLLTNVMHRYRPAR